jgi:hypothetical protein
MAGEFRYQVDENPCDVCVDAALIESKAWRTRCCVVVCDSEERIRHHVARE